MIIVKLMGGLGNQMFQYAFGLMISNNFKQKVLFDVSWFSYYADRKLNLKELKPTLKFRKIDSLFLTIEKILICSAAHARFIRQLNLTSHLENIKKRIHSIEEKFVYTKINESDFNMNILNDSKNYCLEGYWQNPTYFDGIRDIILKNIHFPESSNPHDANFRNQISGSESVAIHVRRGDYVSNKKTNQRLGTCSLEYYQKAAELIVSKVTNAKFFLFTDDTNFVKTNFGFLPNATLVSDPSRLDINELNLMQSCKHFIIANSTFSWWGAWLCQNPEKIVIAPKQWFKNAEANANCKICHKDWIKI